MLIKEILRDAKSQLAESGISEVDAEHLLAHVLGLSRMDLHNPVLVESTLLAFQDKDVLEEQFGSEVADLVLWLTDISKPEDGNRSTRKALDRQHSAAAPAAAQTIKVADLISNTRTIVEFDPGFARTYLEEKRLLLEVLTRANPTLLDQAKNQIG